MLRRRIFSKVVAVEKPFSQAVVGDIYCSDNTIVAPANYSGSGKTAVGIVINNASGVMRLMGLSSISYIWMPFPLEDLPLPNITNIYDAHADVNGFSNTVDIVIYAGNDTLAKLCLDANISGVTGWHLGSAGEMWLYGINRATVDTSRVACGLSAISADAVISTSTEYDSESAWYYYNSSTPTLYSGLPKYTSYPTYPIKKITY